MDEIEKTIFAKYQFQEAAEQLLIEIEPTLLKYQEKKLYGSYRGNYERRIAILMEHLERSKKDRGEYHNVRVLSLGCGSKGAYRSTVAGKKFADPEDRPWQYEGWKPWMPRILHELGFDVVGIDIGNLEEEPYQHFSGMDILDPDSLKQFPDHSFDVIEMNAVTDIIDQTPDYTPNRTIRLLQEVQRILKPDGLFLNDHPSETLSYHFEAKDKNSAAENADILKKREEVCVLLQNLLKKKE